MAILAIFTPELALIAFAALIALGFLVWNLGRIVRNTAATFTALLTWALEWGFFGLAAFILVWVFASPVMAGLCILGGLLRTWAEIAEARDLKRSIRNAETKSNFKASAQFSEVRQPDGSLVLVPARKRGIAARLQDFLKRCPWYIKLPLAPISFALLVAVEVLEEEGTFARAALILFGGLGTSLIGALWLFGVIALWKSAAPTLGSP